MEVCHYPEDHITNFRSLRTLILIESAKFSILKKTSCSRLESSRNFGTALINFYQTKWRHLTEDDVLYGQCREGLRSYKKCLDSILRAAASVPSHQGTLK
jgi:hypothetical protein